MCSRRAQVIWSGRDLLGVDAQAVVAAPQHGALAGGAVDDDVGRLVGAALAQLHVIQVDAGAGEALHLDAAALIVSNTSKPVTTQPSLSDDPFGMPRARRSIPMGAGVTEDWRGSTTAGVGASLLPVRYNCPSEIVVIELRRTLQE